MRSAIPPQKELDPVWIRDSNREREMCIRDRAETEKELGLNITQEQIDELKAHADDINYDVAKAREKEVRHDVMSHVYASVSYTHLFLSFYVGKQRWIFVHIRSISFHLFINYLCRAKP